MAPFPKGPPQRREPLGAGLNADDPMTGFDEWNQIPSRSAADDEQAIARTDDLSIRLPFPRLESLKRVVFLIHRAPVPSRHVPQVGEPQRSAREVQQTL